MEHREVTLEEMLAARETRVDIQRDILSRFPHPLICFTMNIPGPVKDSLLIRRSVQTGRAQLLERLKNARLPVVNQTERHVPTGYEGYFSVQAEVLEVKRFCAEIEDETPLGRLFDMDVLGPDGIKLDRAAVSGGPRNCLICGAPGRSCASRRLHSVEELQSAARRVMTEYFSSCDRKQAAVLALRATLDEVCTTPKPGLVDRNNSGSHRDMDMFTFIASAASLAPYWDKCIKAGQDTQALPPSETFFRLRSAGKQAERDMLTATGGINTHKGIIFSLGTVCAALGRLWRPETPCYDSASILSECASMTRVAVQEDFAAMTTSGQRDTTGARLYLEHHLEGIRGEVSRGLPAVAQIGLPALHAALSAGLNRNDAGAVTLAHLIAYVTDTNMIARGGLEEAAAMKEKTARLLEHSSTPSMKELSELDELFISKNMSPGGCADLLAITYFLHDWASLSEQRGNQV